MGSRRGSLGATPNTALADTSWSLVALQFSSKITWYYIVLVVWLAGLWIWTRVDRSMARLALEAISQEEDAAADRVEIADHGPLAEGVAVGVQREQGDSQGGHAAEVGRQPADVTEFDWSWTGQFAAGNRGGPASRQTAFPARSRAVG